MKSHVLMVCGVLAVSTSAFAQTAAEIIERALAPAPRQAREGATVIQWKPDYTYDTLKKGTNRLVCYDLSAGLRPQAFAVQCTSLGNLPRAAQNRRFEAIKDAAERKKMLDAAEADGTRAKPEYGSMWVTMTGPDQATATIHTTIAVPGGTSQSTGLPDTGGQGGAWVMNAGTSTAHIMVPGR